MFLKTCPICYGYLSESVMHNQAEEHLSWKIVIGGALFSLTVLSVAYWLISPKEDTFFTPPKSDKIAEFQSVYFSSRKDSKKSWEFFANEGWVAKDRQTTVLKDIEQGKIYDGENLVVTSLNSPRAKVWQGSNIVEASGPLSALINLGKISHPDANKPEEWTRVSAQYFKYFPSEKRSEIREKVEIHKNDATIYAQELQVNHQDKTAKLFGNIVFKRQEATLHSDEMEYLSQGEEVHAAKNITIMISGSHEVTQATCGQVECSTDATKDMYLKGTLKVLQGKKRATANEGIYSPQEHTLTLKGSVNALFEKAAALLKEESSKKLDNPEAKNTLAQKTQLAADTMLFSLKNSDAQARGNVVVTQKEKCAKADKAEYNDRQETITLTGNVSIKRGNDWVKAEKVLVSVKEETFQAIGEVEAKFKL